MFGHIRCFMIKQLYDPALEIVSIGRFFRIFMGNLEWLVKVLGPNWGRGRPRITSPSLSVCLSVCLSVGLSVYLSDILLTFLATFVLIMKLKSPSVFCLSFCLSVSLSVCLSVRYKNNSTIWPFWAGCYLPR